MQERTPQDSKIDPQATVPRASRLVPTLTVIYHPELPVLGRQLPVTPEGPVELGRGAEVLGPGALDDGRLSRRHCVIRAEGRTEVVIEDQQSRNGTAVNGRRVSSATLRHGDVITLGKLTLLYTLQPRGFAPAPNPRFVGSSPALMAMIHDLTAVAPGSAPALLVGESGVGRRKAAAELHRVSRHRGPYGVVDCAAESVPSWERIRSKVGQGVITFAHIELAPMPLQRAISDHITALGDGEGLRILATAGGDLRRLVRGGAFDPDLAEHLSRRVVSVPTLRERAEDLIPLAFAFGRAASNDALRPLSQRLTLALSLHPWPQNLRELKDTMTRVCAEQAHEPQLKAPAWLLQQLPGRVDGVEG